MKLKNGDRGFGFFSNLAFFGFGFFRKANLSFCYCSPPKYSAPVLNKTRDFNEFFNVADPVKLRDLLKLPNTNVQFRATENYNIKSCSTNKELQKL